MLKRPRVIALIILVVLALVALSLPSRTVSQLKLALGGLFLPLFGLTSSLQQASEQVGNALTPRQALLDQISQLRQENQQLRFRALQGDEALRENTQLRQGLGWLRQTPWRLQAVRIVSRDPANWWRTVIVDAGSREGLRPNLPVLTPAGLVGRISLVGFTQSQVVLVGDPNCLVAAVVQETRDHGILGPCASAPLDHSLADLTQLARSAVLKPGQKVATSGLGGVFPKGLAIGEVVDVQVVEYGLYTEARIKLAVNLNRLEEVWVLWP